MRSMNTWIGMCSLLLFANLLHNGVAIVPDNCEAAYADVPDDGESTKTCFRHGAGGTILFGVSHKTGHAFAVELLIKLAEYCNEVEGEGANGGYGFTAVTDLAFPSHGMNVTASRNDQWGPTRFHFVSNWYGDLNGCLGADTDFTQVKAVHFVRDPIDTVLSGYNYHRRCKEPWAYSRQNTPYRANTRYSGPEYRSMTYVQLLQQLDTREGLHVEAERSEGTLWEIGHGYCKNRDDSRYMATRFSDYLQEGGYEQACKLFRFMGFRKEHAADLALMYAPEDEGGDEGQRRLDMSFEVKEHHVTAGTYNKEEQKEMLKSSPNYPQIIEVRRALDEGKCEECSLCQPRTTNFTCEISLRKRSWSPWP